MNPMFGLSDSALEDIMLAGARAVPACTETLCSEGVRSYVATPERRSAALAVLRNCANELERRALRRQLAVGRKLMGSPTATKDYLHSHFRGYEYEAFVVLFLDAQVRLIGIEEMFRGTLTQASIYPREIVRRALAHNAASVILAHNHPSGVAEPSRADEHLTSSIRQALSLVDVRVLDHLVIGDGAATSFAERGLL